MIKGVTEGLEEQRQDTEGFDNAAELLRFSIRTTFEVIAHSKATMLHLRHPDGANIAISLNHMTVKVDTDGDGMHLFGIDGVVSPPSNGRWVVRTDHRQPATPSIPKTPLSSRLRTSFNRLAELILQPETAPATRPTSPIIDRGHLHASYVGERQVMSLFVWIMGAHIVGKETGGAAPKRL